MPYFDQRSSDNKWKWGTVLRRNRISTYDCTFKTIGVALFISYTNHIEENIGFSLLCKELRFTALYVYQNYLSSRVNYVFYVI